MNPLFEKPIHLLKPSEDRSKLILSDDAVHALKQIKEPVLVVTVVGTQRGGKSTLLNLLHSRKTSPGFGLGHFYDAQTTGLWIWAKKHPRNADLTVLLMDTEGLDSPHIPIWYNWTLAALAVLISSFFIYQSKGSIDSSATDRLGVILKVAEQIGGRKEDTGSDQPHFLWLIRDSQLNFKQAPKQEMVSMLDRSERRQLENCFAEYDCFPLPRPVESESQLKEVEKLDWNDLRGEFREEYAILERQILSTLSKPRKMSNKVLTGELIATLLEKYVAAVSQKGIMSELSQLPTQQQMVAKMQGERAVKTAIELYSQLSHELEKKFPLPDLDIFQFHEDALKKSTELFMKEVGVDDKSIPKDLQEFYDEFSDKIAKWISSVIIRDGEYIESKKLISGKYFEILQKNVSISRDKCTREIARLFQNVNEKLSDIPRNFKDVKEFHHDLETVKKLYFDSTEAVGACKSGVAEEFFQEKSHIANQISLVLLEKNLREKNEKLSEEFSRITQEIKSAASTQNGEFSSKLEQLKTQISSDNKNITEQLNFQTTELRQKASELEKNIGTISEEFRNKHASMNEELGKKILQTADELRGRISQNVDEVNSRITSNGKKLEEISENLSKKMSQQEENFGKKLSEISSESDKKLTTTIANIDIKINQVTKKIEGDCQEISQNFTKKLSEESERSSKQLAEKSSEIDKKFTATQEEQAKLLSNIKSLETQIVTVSQNSEKGISGISSELKSTISAVTTSLSENIEKRVTIAESKSAEATEKLTKSTQDLRQNLSENISSVEKKISDCNSDLTKKLQEFSEELRAKNSEQDNFAKSLQESITKLNGDFKEQIDDARRIISQNSEDHVNVKNTLNDIEIKITQTAENLDKKFSQNSSELNSQVVSLKKQAEDLTEKFSQDNKSINEKIDELKKQTGESITTLDGKTSQISVEISSLATSLKKTSENVENIEKTLHQKLSESDAKYALEIESVKKSSEELSQNFTSKLTQISDQFSSSADLAQKQNASQIEELKQLISTQENLVKTENSKLYDQLAEISKKFQDVSGNHETEINEIQQKITTINATQSSQISETADLRKNLSELSEKITRENSQVLSQISDLSTKQSNDVTQIEKNIENLSEKLSEQVGVISEQIRKHGEEISIVKDLKQRVVSLSEKLDLASEVTRKSEEKFTEKTNSLSSSFTELSDHVKNLISSASKYDAQIDSLTKETSNVKSEIQGISQFSDSIRSLSSQIDELRQISSQVEHLSKISTQIDELSKLEESVNSNSQKLVTIDGILNTSGKDIHSHSEKISILDSAINSLGSNMPVVLQQIQKLDQAVQSLTVSVNSPPPSYHVTQLSEQMKNVSDQVIKLSEDIGLHTKEIETMKSASSQGHERMKNLEVLSEKTNVVESLTERLKNVENLSDRVNNLEILSTKNVETLTERLKNVESLSDRVNSLEILSEKTNVVESLTERLTNVESLSDRVNNLEILSDKPKFVESLTERLKNVESLSDRVNNLEILSDRTKNLEIQHQQLSGDLKKHQETTISKPPTENMSAQKSELEALQKNLSELSEKVTKIETVQNGLQTATKATFANVEKSLNTLSMAVAQHATDVKNVMTEVQQLRSNVSSRGPAPPPYGHSLDSSTSSIPTSAENLEDVMRAIAGVKSTTTRYTDNAIEGVATTIGDLIRRVQEVETLAKKFGGNSFEVPSGDSDKKFADVYTKISQLNTNIQKLSGKPTSDKKTHQEIPDFDKVRSYVEEQLIEQRKQLVTAMKAHVSNVEDGIKAEIRKISDGSRGLIGNLEKKLENITLISSTSQNSSDSGISNAALITLDAKVGKLVVQLDHVKTSVDAVWGSLGQISSKLVDIESVLDQ